MFDTAATRIVISVAAAAADTAGVAVGILHFLWPLRHCMEDEKPTRMEIIIVYWHFSFILFGAIQ